MYMRCLALTVCCGVLQGCGGDTPAGVKLTAEEAARALELRASVPVQVRCVPDEPPFAGWDYTCTYLDDGNTVGINVDETGITEYSG
jgi:hypothetical protein